VSAYGQNLRRWRIAVATHDVENPGHDPAFGIGLCRFDIDRLKLEVGEELWTGVTLYEDSGQPNMFRIMCNGEHDECDLRIKEARDLPQVIEPPERTRERERERELIPA
jgi:hypothetical protein